MFQNSSTEESKHLEMSSQSSSYYSSDFCTTSMTSDESEGIDEDVKELKKKGKLTETRLLRILKVRDQQLNQCREQIAVFESSRIEDNLRINNNLSARKRLKDSREEDKQEAGVHNKTVEVLEQLHNENIEDVLKDAEDIRPSASIGDWICGVIDKITADDIRAGDVPFPLKAIDRSLRVYMNTDDKIVMKLLKYIKLPCLKMISIKSVKYDTDNHINSFLKHSFPQSLKYFYLSSSIYTDSCNKTIDT